MEVLVQILLKPSLESFQHYFASVRWVWLCGRYKEEEMYTFTFNYFTYNISRKMLQICKKFFIYEYKKWWGYIEWMEGCWVDRMEFSVSSEFFTIQHWLHFNILDFEPWGHVTYSNSVIRQLEKGIYLKFWKFEESARNGLIYSR